MDQRVSYPALVRHWGRLGLLGFGGPPAHIAMLRTLCVTDHQWMTTEEFEHAVATTGLLPGPASTQLAIYCAWRLRGVLGALIGGLCFIVPGLVMILLLTAAFFAQHPSRFLLGAALGAGAVVPAIALSTAISMLRPSYQSVASHSSRRVRWGLYLAVGVATSILAAPYVVVALVSCGVIEIVSRRTTNPRLSVVAIGTVKAGAVAGLGALAWVALKVGALSYGGGFVIIPLMQHDVVSTYHWMSGVQFLNVVALGQITPGPVVLTVAAVGYAAHGLSGGLVATVVAFGPSFLFIIAGARRFEALRQNQTAQAFLAGAAPSVIGAIGGASLPLGLLLAHLWQLPLLALGLGWLLWKKGASVYPLLAAAVVGALLAPVLAV
jgi:chromate transporter